LASLLSLFTAFPVLNVRPASLLASDSPTVSVPARPNVSVEANGPLALISELSGQGSPRARREAAIKFLRSDSPEVAHTLLALLNDKNNDSAKVVLCEAMAEIKCQEPVYTPALFALVQSR